MSYGNLHALVSGFATYFEAQFPTYLAQVGTEIGVTITAPADYVLGYRDVLASDRYPLACLVADAASPEDSGTHGIWLQPKVDIVVAFKHSQPAVLEAQILGCADAIINLIGADESLGGLCDGSSVEYVDMFHGAPGSKDIAVVVVTVDISKEIRT